MTGFAGGETLLDETHPLPPGTTSSSFGPMNSRAQPPFAWPGETTEQEEEVQLVPGSEKGQILSLRELCSSTSSTPITYIYTSLVYLKQTVSSLAESTLR